MYFLHVNSLACEAGIEYYNLTQLISWVHVLIPGNLSVLSGGTVIL